MLQLVKYVGTVSTALVAAVALSAISRRAPQVSCILTKNGFFLAGYPKEVAKVLWTIGSDEAVWEMQENSPTTRNTAIKELILAPPPDPRLIQQLPKYARKMFNN